MIQVLAQVSPQVIADKKIYIVGGGASLVDFDWGQLQGRRVIAVNRAFEKVPMAEIIYFSDLRFWTWNQEALVRHPARKISCMRKLRHRSIEIVESTGIAGLELESGKIRTGNNSGYAAINVAVHEGAKEIVLLGFDMGFTHGRCHWHDGYPVINVEKTFRPMISYFDTLPTILEGLGVKVVNANLDSMITAFSKIRREDSLT